tara:strand:+ start:328 stop:1272 length:945 start_codon:yes stop_codon:yes gene_type:complete
MTRELKVLRAFMLWAVLGSGALIMFLLHHSKISLDYHSLAPVGSSLALLVGTGIVCRMRGFLKSALIMEALAGGIAFSVLVLASTYLAISMNAPLADDWLVAMDLRMGFDGAAFIRLVDGMPLVSSALMLAYTSFSLQLLTLPMLLILFGQPARAFAMVLAYALIGYVSSVVSIWFPALGSHVVYAIEPSSLTSINPHFGYAFLEQFHAVREQSAFLLSLESAEGILTFPSVHAAVALLCAVSAYSIPLLRYPFLALNMLMAIATVTHSNHYLVDVFAGFGVAVASIYGIRILSRMPSAKRIEAFAAGRERSAV